MAYSPKSQKTYNDKCYRFSIKFVPSEQEEVKRFKKYLEESGKTANSYIKELIKKDLDSKGFMINTDNTNTDITSTDSTDNNTNNDNINIANMTD